MHAVMPAGYARRPDTERKGTYNTSLLGPALGLCTGRLLCLRIRCIYTHALASSPSLHPASGSLGASRARNPPSPPIPPIS